MSNADASTLAVTHIRKDRSSPVGWPSPHSPRSPQYTLCGLLADVGHPPIVRIEQSSPDDRYGLQTYSYRHVLIGYTYETDIVVRNRKGRFREDVDRADAIRDGIETLPEPICAACAAEFARRETLVHVIRNVASTPNGAPVKGDSSCM